MVRDIGFEQGSVLPRYGSDCLSSVPSTLLSLFGIENGRAKLPEGVFEGIDTTGVEKVVLFLFDGLGYKEWRRQQDGGLVKLMTERGRVTPITSVFPSTTSTALTTLATGLTPQEHGLIEWYMYLSELDMIIETLPFSPLGSREGDLLRPTTDPRVLFEGETIYSRMMKEDVSVYTFLSKRIARSGYSSVVHEGTNLVTYSYASDLVASLRRSIETSRGPAYFYVYWPLVDTVEHLYGPNTEEARLEAGMISHLLSDSLAGRMDRSALSNVLFLATADHGQIYSPTKDATKLEAFDWFPSSLAESRNGKRILPWGGSRDLYLQAKDQSLEDVKQRISQSLRDTARVFRTSDAVDAGLFGTGAFSPRFRSRVGNLMILPNGTKGVWYQHPDAGPSELKGVHGGLNEDEMTIPFAAMRGSALP